MNKKVRSSRVKIQTPPPHPHTPTHPYHMVKSTVPHHMVKSTVIMSQHTNTTTTTPTHTHTPIPHGSYIVRPLRVNIKPNTNFTLNVRPCVSTIHKIIYGPYVHTYGSYVVSRSVCHLPPSPTSQITRSGTSPRYEFLRRLFKCPPPRQRTCLDFNVQARWRGGVVFEKGTPKFVPRARPAAGYLRSGGWGWLAHFADDNGPLRRYPAA